MTTPGDLSRWNRAGLRHFEYVGGNAATFLEELRLALLYRLVDQSGLLPEEQRDFLWWKRLSRSVPEDPAERAELDALLERHRGALRWCGLWRDLPERSEQGHEYRSRLERQYDEPPITDYAWEILRSFARACHVITGHLDAYANEGFLETATQWDNLRRLVEMVGYHPRPSASAATLLVLLAKTGRSGLIQKGFQVEHTPHQGGPSVVFETLADVEVDSLVDELRPRGWNRSPDIFDPFVCDPEPARSGSSWNPGEEPQVSAGEVGVLVQGRSDEGSGEYARAVVLDRVEPGLLCLQRPQASDGVCWVEGRTRLLLSPKKVFRARLNGADVLTLEVAHGLAIGQVVAWVQGGEWVFDTVAEEEGRSLRPADGSRLPRGVIYRALRIGPIVPGGEQAPEIRVPPDTQAAVYQGPAGVLVALDVTKDFTLVRADGNAEPLYRRLTAVINAAEIYIARASLPVAGPVRAVGKPSLPRVPFHGGPGSLASGDWVVGEGRDGAGVTVRQALQVLEVRKWEDGFELTLAPSGQAVGRAAVRVPEDLLDLLWRIETVLDQDAFAAVTLGELLSGQVANRSVAVIKGIGHPGLPGISYAERLAAAGVVDLADLAQLNTSRAMEGITPARLREFRAKARIVLEARVDPASVRTWLDVTLAQLASEPAIETARAGEGSADEDDGLARLERIFGPFDPKRTLRPEGFDRNHSALPLPYLRELDLDLDALPATFKRGRNILIEREGGRGAAAIHQAVVEEIDGTSITIAPPLRGEGQSGSGGDSFTLGNTIVHGNVVAAGHGAFKGEKVLGSGDATALNQEMLFKVAGVSFVQDSSMPAGVRADIDVKVDGRIWKQVGSLRDSRLADPHYTVRITESGQFKIGFGDGRNGRRLPTGTNNARVSYRQGSGLAGNVPGGGLTKPVKPHKLIAAVRQPLPAVGGCDMEDVTSLREKAPSSLLTLERAVSLKDISDLAASQSGTWQARAFQRPLTAGRSHWIDVIVVPAGGAELDADLCPVVPQQTLDAQRNFLLAHAVPGLAIAVKPYVPVPFDADVTVRIKSAEHDSVEVVRAVRLDLRQAFTLERRRLGQPLYRGELFRVVESVLGVESSDCRIRLQARLADWPRRVFEQSGAGEKVIRSVVPHENQVVYLDERHSTLKIAWKEHIQ